MNQLIPNAKTMGALSLTPTGGVAICAKDPTAQTAESTLDDDAARNWVFTRQVPFSPKVYSSSAAS